MPPLYKHKDCLLVGLKLNGVFNTHSTDFSALTLLDGRQEGHPGPDLQNILRQSHDYLTIMPKLRSTYDGRLIYKTSYNEWKAFHRSDSHAKS